MTVTPKMLVSLTKLTSLAQAQYLDGYFYDPFTKSIWSNKRSNKLQQLAGTAEYTYNPNMGRRYVLGLRKRSYVTTDFVRAYEYFANTGVGKTWIASIASSKDVPEHSIPPATCVVDEKHRTHSALKFVTQKGYMLATIGDKDQLIVGQKPMFHLSMTTAAPEAERIARESGMQVVVLHADRSVKVAKTVWE